MRVLFALFLLLTLAQGASAETSPEDVTRRYFAALQQDGLSREPIEGNANPRREQTETTQIGHHAREEPGL